MVEKIKELIRGFFGKEMANANKLGHDPFKGHLAPSMGKSYFDDSLAEYVGWTGGPCNADTDGEPCDVDFITIGCDKKPGVQIWTLRLIPTLMVCETLGGRGATRPTTMEDVRNGVKCGYEVKTAPTPAPIYVRNVHGCLQLCSTDVKLNSEPTEYITVVVTDEPNVGWTVASVHPGEAGGDIGGFLKKVAHYKSALDRDDGVPPVNGYQEGDLFDPDLLVSAAPDWVFEHLVKDHA